MDGAIAGGHELVIGVVTPVGTNTQQFTQAIKGQFSRWDYDATVVRISDYLNRFAEPPEHEREDYRINRLIDAGDKWCRLAKSRFGLAVVAIQQIRAQRALKTGRAQSPAKRHAYIVHSLKRPGEVELLREVYGENFLLLARHLPREQRRHGLATRLSAHIADAEERLTIAGALIERDEEEDLSPYGQSVRKTYPMADAFLREGDGSELSRLIDLVFRHPWHAPAPGEHAMYMAYATSARSRVPSRRVGAALVSEDGSIVALGMNDVPEKSGELPDSVMGYDYSEREKRELGTAVLRAMRDGGALSESVREALDDMDNDVSSSRISELIQSLPTSDIIEFQRAVHAEMRAMIDAADRGMSLQGCKMYGTTYPCHLCWKHILASGIEEMYYIDSYPKSRASAMYEQSTEHLKAFTGVAPRAYMRLFMERDLPGASPDATFVQVPARDSVPVGSTAQNLMTLDLEQDYLTTFADDLRRETLGD